MSTDSGPSNPRYHIRPATTEDIVFLVQVVIDTTRTPERRAEFDQPEWRSYYARWTGHQIRGGEAGSEMSVIELDGSPVGRLRIVRTDELVDLAGIQLTPKAQGLGIGTAIVESLKTEATASGVPLEIRVEKDNLRAIQLYNRLGLVRVGDTEDEHVLRWPC